MEKFSEIFSLITSMAPFLLLGFFLAGVMHVFVPSSLYKKHLGKKSFKSVLYSTLIAIPLPLCSCGVIPVAMSLRKEGASRGAVISFLIATPQTGVDSILATYSLMGLPFAIVRPIAALVTALFGGVVSNALDTDEDGDADLKNSVTERPKTSFWQKIKDVFHYAYMEMMQDIGKWLLVGLIIAGLITVFVPDTFFHQFSDKPILGILLVLVCAVPMYVCATGSIPIAVALMMKGLSPGAALVLLMAGPAVNVASLMVLGKVMGKKSMLIYMGTVVIGAIIFALGIDYLFPREVFTSGLIGSSGTESETGPSYFRIGCAILMLVLLFNALFRRYFVSRTKGCSCGVNADGTCSVPGTATAVGAGRQIIHIKGLKCNHCRENAEKAILSVKGVEKAIVDLTSGEAVIDGQYNMNEVVKAVESLGFEAVLPAAAPTIIHIKGLKCNHCRENAEKAILSVKGVENAVVDLTSGEAVINGRFDMAEIVKAVESLGFEVKEAAKSHTVEIHIKGLKCNHCRENAEKAILSVKGVEKAVVDLTSGQAIITGNFNMDEIVKSVESLGFEVKK